MATGDLCPTPSASARVAARERRWILRRSLWRVSKDRRLANCGRAVRGSSVEVHAVADEAEGVRGALSGLTSCSSVWSCPVCSAHIRQRRAEEIAEGARIHQLGGGSVVFVTLTLRHSREQGLAETLGGLLSAWRAVTKGKAWDTKRREYSVVGHVRSTEVTWGEASGWHPHLHVAFFVSRELNRAEIAWLETWLFDRWQRNVARLGLGEVSRTHGVRLEVAQSGEAVGMYVAKVQERSLGLEMARGDLKSARGGNLTPFDILAAAGYGERWAIDLWREFETVVKGRRAIEWSRGLRTRLGLGAGPSDEAIAEESVASSETLVCEVDVRSWRAVVAAALELDLLDAAVVGVEAVESVVLEALSIVGRRSGPRALTFDAARRCAARRSMEVVK